MSTRSTRAADRALIADLEAEISGLEKCIQAMRSEKATIWERLNAYAYPVLTLPNEIVSEIFVQFLPEYPSRPPMVGDGSPSHLLQVCRLWRDIALSTPVLWRAIDPWCLEDEMVEMAEKWLQRSGSCRLSIEITFDTAMHFIDPRASTVLQRLIKEFLPHRSRWEYFKLNVCKSFLPIIGGSIPMLRQLEIQLSPDFSSHEKAHIVFHDAACLRNLTIDHLNYPLDAFPWVQLTSLTLLGRTPLECAPVLNLTINLIQCRLIVSADEEQEVPDIRTRLPHLELLRLENFSVADAPPIGYLETFIVPSLKALRVPDSFLFEDDPPETLNTFIQNSGCKLEEMCITGTLSITEDEYREALPFIPNISFNTKLVQYSDDLDLDPM